MDFKVKDIRGQIHEFVNEKEAEQYIKEKTGIAKEMISMLGGECVEEDTINFFDGITTTVRSIDGYRFFGCWIRLWPKKEEDKKQIKRGKLIKNGTK